MDSRPTDQLLAHFNPPFDDDVTDTAHCVPSRGVLWVLKWSAALAVLTYGACNLLQIAYYLAAERELLHAVKAGALEATLPQATRTTVAETVERHLKRQLIATTYATITIRQNEMPIARAARFAEGSVVSVSAAIPASDVLPTWLHTITANGSDSKLQASAERRVPGKHLPVVSTGF